MIVDTPTMQISDFTRATGWDPKPEGLCRGEVCVPAPGAVDGDHIDVRSAAERLGMPIVESPEHDVYAVGPATLGGKALTTALAADTELVHYDGTRFSLSSLRGKKVLLVAWSSY